MPHAAFDRAGCRRRSAPYRRRSSWSVSRNPNWRSGSAGYASLSHLRQFPIDKLKIDKSFVQSVESAAIVDAAINMGISLGMQVVAEGVEKAEQLGLLRLKGCDFVQGYIFAKPTAPERIAPFIAKFHAAKTGAKKLASG